MCNPADRHQSRRRDETRCSCQIATAPELLRGDATRSQRPTRRFRPRRQTRLPLRLLPASRLPRRPLADESRASSFRGFFRLRCSGAVYHLAHQRGFGGQLAVYRRSPLEFAEIATPIEYRHFHSQLIPRHHRPAKARAIHRRKSEEHTSELQSPCNLVCRLLLEKKKKNVTKTLNTASKTMLTNAL